MASCLKRCPAVALNLLFPDNCRVCDEPLQTASRIPVCAACLAAPRSLSVDTYCRQCLTPFLDDFALDEHDLCSVCRQGLGHFDSVYCYGRYEDPLRALIQNLKYSKVVTLAPPLSRFLVRALPVDARFDVVVPMPMHWRKKWQRGFNQAELLAKPVARLLGIPLSTHLKRSRYTKAQASLGHDERQANLKHSFVVNHTEALVHKKVLLIDDVLTTGATLQEAARTLKEQGRVATVCALTLARVDAGSNDSPGGSKSYGRSTGVKRPVDALEPRLTGVS